MRWHWLLAGMTGLLLAADKPADDPVKKEIDKMQGTWTVVAHEDDGQKTTEEQNKKANIKLLIRDDHYTVHFGEQKVSEGSIKPDPTQKPLAIDINDDAFKGQVMKAIYEVDGDTMKVCYGQPGKARPKEFTAKEGSKQMMMTYKRVKP